MAVGWWIRRGMLPTIVAVLAASIVFIPGTASPAAAAANGGDFSAGNIITDQNFHNTATMNTAQIQSFLQNKEPSCSPGATCLKNYSVDTFSRSADNECAAYNGQSGESAASIIWHVALVCSINPQVLLVLLEKEQSLVSSTNPSTARYTAATGYACPDSTGCSTDPQYGGLYNQLYWAAWQFQYYEKHTTSFGYYGPGAVRNIQYNPDKSCGSAAVYIENQATADLYYYTPYTPDGPALANLYGTGGSCSSYGNRNFWRIFSDWFGSPNGPRSTFGSLDGSWSVPSGIEVVGWAFDPYGDGTSSYAWVTIDGVGSAVAANQPLDWFNGLYPGAGPNHGFDSVLPATPGSHQVCAYNASNALLLACKTVTVTSSPNAAGAVESGSIAINQVTIAGWAIDKRTSGPTSVRIEVDGVAATTMADLPDPAAAAAYPALGANHGFRYSAKASIGQHLVCVYGTDEVSLGCKLLTVPESAHGSFDSATVVNGGISLSGWALDLATPTASSYIWYTLDGVGGPALASAPLNWIDTYFAQIAPYNIAHVSPNHGFNVTVPAGLGTHQVCVWISGGSNIPLGCRTNTVR